jgi:hypothetical protein
MAARINDRNESTTNGALPPRHVLNGTVATTHNDKANSHLPILVFRNRKRHPENKVAKNMLTYKMIGSLMPGRRISRTLLNARNTYASRR